MLTFLLLFFFLFCRCLDILSDYLRGRSYGFERIDGSVRGDLRQAAIDRFSGGNGDSFVFLLCTRAGGVGINLTGNLLLILGFPFFFPLLFDYLIM